MAVIHISQEEAERDFASLLKRMDANTSFVIENGTGMRATLQAPFRHRTIDCTIARLHDCTNARMRVSMRSSPRTFSTVSLSIASRRTSPSSSRRWASCWIPPS